MFRDIFIFKEIVLFEFYLAGNDKCFIWIESVFVLFITLGNCISWLKRAIMYTLSVNGWTKSCCAILTATDIVSIMNFISF